jgi:hypothetical protein
MIIDNAAPSRLTIIRIARKTRREKVLPDNQLPSETVKYAPNKYIPAKVSDTRPEIYSRKFRENDRMII